MNIFPNTCGRCPADLRRTHSIMSKFDTAHLCPACKAREKAHPAYKVADAAEVAAVRAGQFNFPGVGCPVELHMAPCLAEQFVIEADTRTPREVRALAATLGTLEGADENGAERFVFSDGSAAMVLPIAPVAITISQYPAR